MALKGKTNEEKIWNFFIAEIGNAYAVAGIMGNLYAESSLMPNNLQNNGNAKLGMTDDQFVAAVDNGSYSRDKFINDGMGFGIAQFTWWELKRDLYDYWKSYGGSIGDLEMQCRFLIKEFQGEFKSVYNALKNAKSVLEASNVMLLKFERPADQSVAVQNKRAAFGQKYYDKYATSTAHSSPTELRVGDVVQFTGNKHYVGSGAVSSSPCKPGQAKVTVIAKNAKHPYHLIAVTGKGSNVYGWVDAADIAGLNTSQEAVKPQEPAQTNSTFKQRTAAPSASDKYWIHNTSGGLNECIKIGGTNSCIPNCVGYAWGRFYEITGKRPNLSRRNAEDWYGYTADGYKRSQSPVPGAVICWRKGQAGNANDGAGHVAIVEEVKSNGDIVTSNSAYNGTRFYMKTLTKASGYSMGGAYVFQGFILPPNSVSAPIASPAPTPSPSVDATYKVCVTANVLNIRQGAGTDYPLAGSIYKGVVCTIVDEATGKGATKWGKLKSNTGWISLDYVKKV